MGAEFSGLAMDGRRVSRDELMLRARRAAALLAERGLERGGCIALLLRNGQAFLEATLAAQHLGAYAVPINWHFTPAEVAYVLQDCGARILVAEADLVAGLGEAVVKMSVFLAPGASSGSAGDDWAKALEARAPHAGSPQSPVQSMIYTSGTTGRPKGVRRAPISAEQAPLLARIRQQIYESERGMRALLAAPLYHSAPNFYALSTLQHEGALFLKEKFDAEDTLRSIAEHRITHMFVVPTMFVRLLALPEEVKSRYDLSSLRWVLHAGAPCPPTIKAAMIEWWGPVITEYYGSTELGPLTFCRSADWLSHPGTVGRPLAGVELSIRDETGAPCPVGEAGEICVDRTAQADFTYHGDDEKRRRMALAGGLATGDVGYLDSDGFLFICERRTDMIISGGVNIYPAEIEAALLAIPGVRDCAVIGAPDPEFGETVVAFVEREPSASALNASSILADLRGSIAGYKVPRRIEFRPALPRDDSGKIFKRKLRDLIAVPAA